MLHSLTCLIPTFSPEIAANCLWWLKKLSLLSEFINENSENNISNNMQLREKNELNIASPKFSLRKHSFKYNGSKD